MAPVELDGGVRENIITATLYNWWDTHQKGVTLSPSAGFKLPDGSIRSADGAWISEERLQALTREERSRFAAVVPDFVVELRSSSDRIGTLKRKMTDVWIKNGVRLAWLIDPRTEKTFIYRADGSKEELQGFDHVLSGESVCPGLLFPLLKLRMGK